MHQVNPVRCFASLRDLRRTGALSAAQTWFSQQSPLLDDQEPKPSWSLQQSAFLRLWLVTPGLVTDLFLVGTHDKTTSCSMCEWASPGETSPSRDHSAWMVKTLLTGQKQKSVAIHCWIEQHSLIKSEVLEGRHYFSLIDYFCFWGIWPTFTNSEA